MGLRPDAFAAVKLPPYCKSEARAGRTKPQVSKGQASAAGQETRWCKRQTRDLSPHLQRDTRSSGVPAQCALVQSRVARRVHAVESEPVECHHQYSRRPATVGGGRQSSSTLVDLADKSGVCPPCDALQERADVTCGGCVHHRLERVTVSGNAHV